jgi:hypothetical protein
VSLILIAGVIGVVIASHSTRPGPTQSTGQNQSSSTTSPPASAVGSGYLAIESDAVAFIQWNQSGNRISGSAQVETLSGSAPSATVSSSTVNVTGDLSGSDITLSFNGGNDVFGTLSSGSFTVNFAQNDGSLAPVTFTSASTSQFNQALTTLENTTASSNQSAAAANTVSSEKQAIGNWTSTVEQDISGIETDEGTLTSDFGGFAGDLTQTRSDLATVAGDERAVDTESQNGTDPDQVCSDSDNLQSDADTVESDGDTLSGTADSVEGDLSTIRSDVSTIQQDFASLQNAESKQPSFSDGAPSEGTVGQSVAMAQSSIATVLQKSNVAIAQVNSYETQAYDDAVAAANAGNCSGPAAPYLQPTIS